MLIPKFLKSVGLPIIVLLMISCTTILFVAERLGYQAMDKISHVQEKDKGDDIFFVVQTLIEKEVFHLKNKSELLKKNKELGAVVASQCAGGDANITKSVIERITEGIEIDILVITNKQGIITYNNFDQDMLNTPYNVWGIEEVLEGEEVVSVSDGPAGWGIRTMIPLYQDLKIVGTLIMGSIINNHFASWIAKATKTRISFATMQGVLADSNPEIPLDKTNLKMIRDSLLRNTDIVGINHQQEKIINYKLLQIVDESFCLVIQIDVSHSHETLAASRKELRRTFAAIVIAVIVLAALLVLFLIQPLRKLKQRVEIITNDICGEDLDLLDDGNEVKTLVLAFDSMDRMIKEHFKKRVQAEKELEDKQVQLAHTGRLTALGEMATGIAHEINQPLNIIILAVCVLKKHFAGDDSKSFASVSVTKIEEQVERAAKIITNMRSFSRRGNGHFELVNLLDPMDRSLSFFKEQFRLHEIELEEVVADKLPLVKLDPQKFEQIVVNLLSNARYAVEKKREEVGADFQKKISINLFHLSATKFVVFEVIDNGIGMTSEEKERALEPFFSTKEVGKGTGLGLTIVNNIITEFCGKIEIDSQKGQGTAFRILIPDEENRKKKIG